MWTIEADAGARRWSVQRAALSFADTATLRAWCKVAGAVLERHRGQTKPQSEHALQLLKPVIRC
jgi:hypothetical protein